MTYQGRLPDEDDFSFSDETLADALRSLLVKLTERDQQFARSLLQGFDRYGGFTDRQRPCVENLLERATRPPQAAKPAEPAAQVGDLAPLMAMFAKVGKRPMLMIREPTTDARVKLSLADPNGRNPGHLYVKADRGAYLGKVTPSGAWHPARDADPMLTAAVPALMAAFLANPTETATRYGRETGQCCMCARKLTDPRSVQVGYGPDCADRWGLPWG